MFLFDQLKKVSTNKKGKSIEELLFWLDEQIQMKMSYFIMLTIVDDTYCDSKYYRGRIVIGRAVGRL
jgi:hypothetical protein